MYPHTSSSTADLDALRARLYRPDPPEGAVEAYLAALHAEAAEGATPVVASRRRVDRRLVATALLGAAVVAVLAPALATAPAHRAPGAVLPVVAAPLELPPVAGSPIGVLYGPDGTTGLFDGRGEPVVVSVNCSGAGTLQLRIADEAPIDLPCEPGGPALAMLPSTGALGRFTVAVTMRGAVRWSIAVGTEDLASA